MAVQRVSAALPFRPETSDFIFGGLKYVITFGKKAEKKCKMLNCIQLHLKYRWLFVFPLPISHNHAPTTRCPVTRLHDNRTHLSLPEIFRGRRNVFFFNLYRFLNVSCIMAIILFRIYIKSQVDSIG